MHEKHYETCLKNADDAIKKELFGKEGRRNYLVLLIEYTGKASKYTVTEAYLGKKRPNTAEFKAYATEVKKAAEKRLAGARLCGNKAEARRCAWIIVAAEKAIIKQ